MKLLRNLFMEEPLNFLKYFKIMKLIRLTAIAFIITTNCFGQNIDSIQKKFATKVCNCIGEVKKYEDLKPKIDMCYDTTMNFIFNDATPEEIKFYTGTGNLKVVAQKLEYYLKSSCPSVINVIQEYIKPKDKGSSYPTNFDNTKLEDAKKDLHSWNGKTIAFNAEIIKVNKSNPEKTFLKVKLDNGGVLWVGDMANSKFDNIGNKTRFVGYFILAEKDNDEQTELGYLVISFASLDLETYNLTMYPGSEKQIYEWANGEVPKSKK